MRKFALLFSLLIFHSVAFAAVQTPHEKIAVVTQQVISAIDGAKGYFDKDPQRFYTEVEGILTPLVDFPSFTRSVMGPFGTKAYYQSLKTPTEKEAYKKNYQRFVDTFKGGLITTYGKGLLAFNGQKIEIVPATAIDLQNVAKGDYVDVIQTIQGEDALYQVIYKMRPDKKGEWMLRNVTIETINVGLLYRNQFVELMAKHKNDFGVVIDNWTVESKDTEDQSAETLKAAAKR
jgi:phospholipid transport system substrate-binding protein